MAARSHWRIPELHGGADLVECWNSVKRTDLVSGVRKLMLARPNGRSADFVGPGASNGCAMARALTAPRALIRRFRALPPRDEAGVAAVPLGSRAPSAGNSTDLRRAAD